MTTNNPYVYIPTRSICDSVSSDTYAQRVATAYTTNRRSGQGLINTRYTTWNFAPTQVHDDGNGEVTVSQGCGSVEPIPAHYINLKPNTKYRVMMKSDSEARAYRDITQYCTPYFNSIEVNNGSTTFNDLTSTNDGKMWLLISSIGTAEYDESEEFSWSNFWRAPPEFNLNNVVLVESSNVLDDELNPQLRTIISENMGGSGTVETYKNEYGETLINQPFDAEYIQTFFVDPNQFNNSQTVDITDVTLYFRNKPHPTNNTSIENPGVKVALLNIVDGVPDIENQYANSKVYKEWADITSSTDAEIGTIFEFNPPVRIQTGKMYAIAISVDDAAYDMWENVRGHVLVNSSLTSTGNMSDYNGDLYLLTNSSREFNNSNFTQTYSKKESIDLKFEIHCAKYDVSSNLSFDFVHSNYEFLSIRSNGVGDISSFAGSEYVYKSVSPVDVGTLTTTAGSPVVTGVGTNFAAYLQEGDSIIIKHVDGRDEVAFINDIDIDTQTLTMDQPLFYGGALANYLVTAIAKVYFYDYDNKVLFLKDSNATENIRFVAEDTIIGIDSNTQALITSVDTLPISSFIPTSEIEISNLYDVTPIYNFSAPAADGTEDAYDIQDANNELNLTPAQPNHIRNYSAVVLSRSAEVDAINNTRLYLPDELDKSSIFRLQLSYNGDPNSPVYDCPRFDISNINMGTRYWNINEDLTNEHTNNGNASTKHISNVLTFDRDQAAEDIRVILNGYRPRGTDIHVYAKIHNRNDPESLNTKNWTKLDMIKGSENISDLSDPRDYREFEYGFPATIPSNAPVAGTFDVSVDGDILTGVDAGDVSTLVQQGDIIKIYNELFPENFAIVSVDSANTTAIVLVDPLTNTSLKDQSGFKLAHVTTPQTAFNNLLENNNIVRYHNSDGVVFDTYHSVMIKIVLTAENYKLVPKVEDYRVIGVSV